MLSIPSLHRRDRVPKIVHHDQRRDLIADAAAGVIAQRGFTDTKLRDIAAATGFSTGACRHYFRDKESLLCAAVERVFTRIFLKLAAVSLPLTMEEAEGILPCTTAKQKDWRVWVAYCGAAVTSPPLQIMHERHYGQLEAILMARLPGIEAERRMLAGTVVTVIDGIGLYATVQPRSWPPNRQRDTLRTLLASCLPAQAAVGGGQSSIGLCQGS